MRSERVMVMLSLLIPGGGKNRRPRHGLTYMIDLNTFIYNNMNELLRGLFDKSAM
jgi:hypothetical protein